MTRRAIRDAFDGLKEDRELQGLEDAARSRSEADWLVGMNATRAATTQVGSPRNTLSLGRVQTPTLALIVGRDTEIERFVPEDYWQVRATFLTEAGEQYTGLWRKGSSNRLKAAEEAERIAAAAKGADARVASVEQKPIVEQSQLLYDLTTLQREANQRFGFTADRTLRAAQANYDQHKVLTYPRTSSRYLSTDMYPSLQSIAAARRPRRPDLRRRRALRREPRPAAARPRHRRRQGHRPPRDHPDRRRARPVAPVERRAPHLRPRRQALPGRSSTRRRASSRRRSPPSRAARASAPRARC